MKTSNTKWASNDIFRDQLFKTVVDLGITSEEILNYRNKGTTNEIKVLAEIVTSTLNNVFKNENFSVYSVECAIKEGVGWKTNKANTTTLNIIAAHRAKLIEIN